MGCAKTHASLTHTAAVFEPVPVFFRGRVAARCCASPCGSDTGTPFPLFFPPRDLCLQVCARGAAMLTIWLVRGCGGTGCVPADITLLSFFFFGFTRIRTRPRSNCAAGWRFVISDPTRGVGRKRGAAEDQESSVGFGLFHFIRKDLNNSSLFQLPFCR